MHKITSGGVFDIYRAPLDMFIGIHEPILCTKFDYLSRE